MPVTHTVTASPIGALTLVGRDGALTGLFMDDQRHRPDDGRFGERSDHGFGPAAEQLAEYFAGERTDFDVPMVMEGTDFQRRVWTALRDIPYGETISYGELARRVGNPKASRAVGLANGRNPIGVIVPCHRVVGASGSLTGYGGGIERKRWLLNHERARLNPRLLARI